MGAWAKARTFRGIDDDDRQAGRRQARGDHRFVAAGRFEAHDRDPKLASRFFSSASPVSVLATTNRSPDGRTATSSLSLAMSIPTITASIRSHPCASGLALRPKRLFGFDGTADEDPRFSTGLVSLDQRFHETVRM